jgi:hypothetical protein
VGELLVEADWFDAEWGYALPVTVDNPSMGTLSEWTLALDVDGTTAGGAAVLGHADAGGADLRLVQLGSPQTVSLQSLGTWSATLGRGRLWWQEGSLPAGVSQYKLFFGNPTALSSDDPDGVFSYTNAYASRYALQLSGTNAMFIASGTDSNAYATGAQSGTLDAGTVATVQSSGWTTGQAISAQAPVEIEFEPNTSPGAAPRAFASTLHSMVFSRGMPNHFTLISPDADTTVSVMVDGVAAGSVALTAGVAGVFESDIPAGAVIRFSASAGFLVAHQALDGFDGVVLPPPAAEVWGFRSGTPRILAVDADTDVTWYDSSGNSATLSISSGAVAALSAGGSGTGEALRLVAVDSVTGNPARVTVIAEGDGDGKDAITFHPHGNLGRSWVLAADATFVLIGVSEPGTTCTLTPPGSGAAIQTTSAATPGPAYPSRAMFGTTTGNNFAVGSRVDCESHGFAYYEPFGSQSEHNLYPAESHRKVTAASPTVVLGSVLETRYPVAMAISIDTPDALVSASDFAWTNFQIETSEPSGATITYQVSIDQGATWLIPEAGAWIEAVDPAAGVTADAIRMDLGVLDTSTGRIRVRALLVSADGVAPPVIDTIRIAFEAPPPLPGLGPTTLPLLVIILGSTAILATLRASPDLPRTKAPRLAH